MIVMSTTEDVRLKTVPPRPPLTVRSLVGKQTIDQAAGTIVSDFASNFQKGNT